jgi:chemosensory pili system protein ChpA (sensor histidine kinase/response regulator)
LLVLIVEDFADTREMFARFLTSKGFETVTAADGIDGLDAARKSQPDAVILDLGLPKMDGWALAQQLRADSRTAKICIVAVTGHGSRESRERAMKAGVNGFLVKPVTPEDVHDELQRLLIDRRVTR